MHRYLYASGDPANRIDPGGEEESLVGLSFSTTITATLVGAVSGAVLVGGKDAKKMAQGAYYGAEASLGLTYAYTNGSIGITLFSGLIGAFTTSSIDYIYKVLLHHEVLEDAELREDMIEGFGTAVAATAFGTAQNAWTQGLIAGGLTFYQDEVDHFAADYGKTVSSGIVLEQIANGLGDGLAAMLVTIGTASATGTPFRGKIVKEAAEILDHLTEAQIQERIATLVFARLQYPISYIVKIIDGNIDASSEAKE